MEVRILALFRSGDNASIAAHTGAGLSCPYIQFAATRSLHADQSALRLQGNRTAAQKQPGEAARAGCRARVLQHISTPSRSATASFRWPAATILWCLPAATKARPMRRWRCWASPTARTCSSRNGAWDRNVYLPAYVRRYPFCMARVNVDKVEQADRLICVEKAYLDDQGETMFDDGRQSAAEVGADRKAAAGIRGGPGAQPRDVRHPRRLCAARAVRDAGADQGRSGDESDRHVPRRGEETRSFSTPPSTRT